MIIRPATREDIRRFYGKTIPMTTRAVVAERDGEIVGVGGYYLSNGVAIAFTNTDGSMSKREIILGGRSVMDLLKNFGGPVVARSDEKSAIGHFGFVESGGVWVLK